MSYQSTKAACTTLNTELQKRFEDDASYMLDISGRPNFRVLAWNPFAYENYGWWHNRAPFVAGQLALRAFITAPTEDDLAVLHLGVQSGREGYGFRVNSFDPGAMLLVNRIVTDLGHPEFRMTGRE